MPTARIHVATEAVELDDEETRPAFMTRHLRHDGLLILPMTGRTVSIDEPGLFNRPVAELLASVESGRGETWTRRATGRA